MKLLLALLLPLAGGDTNSLPLAPAVPAESYREHVAWLADDARMGRETGTDGLEETAAYVAREFAEAGLEPLGDDGTFLQHFTVEGRRVLAEGNVLLLDGEELALDEEWRPFYTAKTGEAAGPVVFAGYGIVDESIDYDDFAGLDVEDAIVVVLRKGPRASFEGTHFTERANRHHMSFVRKINNAFQRGAAGVLVVNDPANHPPEEDTLVPYGPIGPSAPGATLPAAQLTAAAGQRLFATFGMDLAEVQDRIDEEMTPRSFPMPSVRVRVAIATETPKVPTMNVVGLLPGSDPALAHEHVIVGAHMDHVGVGRTRGSLAGDEGRGQIHNGADDNASGTAAVIELAHLLGRESGLHRRGIVLTTFSGEEWGLLGAAHYAEEPALPLEDAVAMLNMDMIGRSEEGYLSVQCLGTAEGLRELVSGAHDDLGLAFDMDLSDDVPPNSDHAEFFQEEVPVVSFFTGLHEDYHRPGDDVEKVNVEAAADITRLVGEVARRLANDDERPVFTEPPRRGRRGGDDAEGDGPAADEPVAAADDPHAGDGEQQVSGYGVSFGTIPDMSYGGDDGVRLSGVRADSSAERAGLREGDVIVALGTVQDDDSAELRPIATLEDYAVLLFSHRPGDRIAVEVRREGRTFEVRATLEGKGQQ